MPRETGEGQRPVSYRALWVAGIIACVLVLVVAGAGLAGGLEKLPPEQLPTVAPEQTFAGEPWDVTVLRASLHEELEPARLDDEANHWLAVVAEVEVTAPRSFRVGDAIAVAGIGGLISENTAPSVSGAPAAIQAEDIRLLRDAGAFLPTLHPGLPEEVVFLWERASDEPPPAEVEVQIIGKTYREMKITGHKEWLDDEPRARVLVPVEDRRGEEPDQQDEQ